MTPPHRINGMYPVGPAVAIMIGNEARPTVSVNGPVEVVENEESGEPETGPPEGVRDPRVHVIVIPRRRVVSDDGRPLVVVVVVNYIGI
jgi:hypothetical protein